MSGSPTMTATLPYEIKAALVQACGRLFWYRDSYRSFLLSAGVPSETYDRYRDQSKYSIARHVIADLERDGDTGFLVLQKLVTEFCKLRDVPTEASDRDAAIKALRDLKSLALEQKLYQEDRGDELRARRQDAAIAAQHVAERAARLEQLCNRYKALLISTESVQERGYALEATLSELFALAEIPYRKSYRTATEQIDGHFSFMSFDYLVESRWRKAPPTEADLGALKLKADKKITSTRAMFVSIVGFRSEVIDEFTRGVTSNMILMDGADLMLILEGRVSLVQALEYKIQKAAQEGVIFAPVRDIV